MPPERGGVVLFEDALVSQLGPIVLGRPVFDLVLGAMTLRRRIEGAGGCRIHAAFVRPHLVPLLPQAGLRDQRKDVPAAGAGRSPRGEPTGGAPGVAAPQLWVNGALVADEAVWERLWALEEGRALCGPDGRLVGLRAGPEAADPLPVLEEGAQPGASGFSVDIAPDVRFLRHSWDLIGWQVETLSADLSRRADRLGTSEEGLRVLPETEGAIPGVTVRGPRVLAAESARIEGPAVLDSREGPILIRGDGRIGPFSVLEGPVVVDVGAQVLGGSVASSYIGPHCRVRGEIESSVLLGWSNKAHDGFVGHSYLGSWVNLGALTTTSDLKNNYGVVRMPEAGELQSTGRIKVGSLIADHAKTAIGTLLGAGTVIGLGSNLFGASRDVPRWVPSFVWGVGSVAQPYELERFLSTAEAVYGRRGQALSQEERNMLREAFRATEEEREAWLRSEGN